ncbi:hypothetical protein Tco_0550615 [Tanacetum coccineum]
MLERYNHYITFRADKLPITKISYKINNATKDATMRIERNKQPLSLTFYEKFVLKKLGFSEWIEIHALASKVKSKSNDLLLKNLKAKFEWIKTQAEKLGIPPPSELTPLISSDNGNFDLVFQREEEFHLATTTQLIRLQNAIQRGSLEVEEMLAKLELTIEAKNDVIEARKVVKHNFDGLGQHIRLSERILVTYIIKEFKELQSRHTRWMDIKLRYSRRIPWLRTVKGGNTLTILLPFKEEQAELKLFFKTELGGKLNNMLWRDKRIFELKHVPSTKLVKVVNSWQNYSLKYGRDVSKNGRALNTSYVLHRILDKLQPPPLSMQPCISINIECCKE